MDALARPVGSRRHDRTVDDRSHHLTRRFVLTAAVATSSRLGRYELLARIATGGMGEIFLARLEGVGGFEKLYVVKRILPHLANNARFRDMLIAEARVASNMSHANICHVYELDETDNQLYIVMEYLEGVTLLAVLRKFCREKRRLDDGFVAGVIAQVAAGLHYAHELRSRDGELLGIVHRDVTPSNIFLTETGVVKLHDFGVAKVTTTATSTESGTVKGKFAYMAPEQLAGADVDRRADVFTLGVVAAEMLTGRGLFQRRTDYLTLRAVMEQPIPDVRRHRPDLPEAVAAVVNRALARDPAERFATARQFAAALTQALPPAWGQAEISELVYAEFTDEMQRHNTEISGVIGRASRGTVRTMPIILQNPSDPDAEEYFAFETGVELEPLAIPAPPVAAQPPAVVRAARWPYLVVALVAAASLAVGLVAIPEAASSSTAPVTPTDSYLSAIAARDADLSRCGLDGSIRTALHVAADGHVTEVTFTPGDAGQASLATCLRDVLTAVRFPAASEDVELSVALRASR